MRRRWGSARVVGVLAVALAGCGADDNVYAPTGVDELVIPTPSPAPTDFVATIDNPWLALTPAGATYRITGAVSGTDVVTVEQGPEIDGVSTTAVLFATGLVDGAAPTDYLAQDTRGNVWWFGREGVWQAGVGGAEAGLFMAADPRFGDGYRTAPGSTADVIDVDATVEGSTTDYDHVVVIDTTDADGRVERSYYASGVGLVHQETTAGEPAAVLDLVARPAD